MSKQEVGYSVIGFFLDRDGDLNNPADVFVAIEEDGLPEGDIVYYTPIGQHGQCERAYMEEDCTEITKEEYIAASTGYYTPGEYLR